MISVLTCRTEFQCRDVTISNDLRLGQQLCFSLYAATNAITRVYRAPLARLGLTYPQYLVVLVLLEGGSHTVKSLADTLDLDSSTLTPLLRRLDAAGFVSRERDLDDQRAVSIRLTPAGQALRRPIAAVRREVGCRTELSDAALDGLRRQLHALSAALVRPRP